MKTTGTVAEISVCWPASPRFSTTSARPAKHFRTSSKASKHLADAYRHEWVSLRLFEAFVGMRANDDDWLDTAD